MNAIMLSVRPQYVAKILNGEKDKEIWKDIEGYERLYLVSSFGRLKALEKKVGGSGFIQKEMIVKQRNYGGYCYYNLSKNGVQKMVKFHRIIAKTFILNPLNKPTVNHINGIKNDNRIENLEWATRSENQKHAFALGLQRPCENQRKSIIKLNERKRKAVILIDNENNTREFESMTAASKYSGLSISAISRYCSGKRIPRVPQSWQYIMAQTAKGEK